MVAAVNTTFLDACQRKPTPYTPIWLMRQAGRYQESYRAVRAKVDFLELCKTPELACQVTVDAVEQLGVDAAIIFADILLILEPLGIGFHFEKNHGPKIETPVRTAAQVDAMPESIEPRDELGYVMDAIKLARRALDVPLIGFAAAPFTLASYAIEGGGSKNYFEAKKIMLGDPGLWDTFMAKISAALADYLCAQIEAGAQAVQLFDSWIGALSPADYRARVQPHVASIFSAVKERHPDIPALHFGTGNPDLYPAMQEAGGDIIGVDWRVGLADIWETLGGPERTAIMGNLDPANMLVPHDVMKRSADSVLAEAAGRPGHIFNLGHGLMPQTNVDQVKALVDHVHEASQR